MSVASRNPFAILNDDEVVQPSKPVQTGAATTTPSTAPTTNNRRGNDRNRGGPASRGGKYYPRGGGVKTADAPAAREEGQDTGARFDRTTNREDRPRGRGRGRGGERGGGRGGRRPFDKHSQTGHVDSEKQVNQGWGADTGTAELSAETAAVADATADAQTAANDDAGASWGETPGDATAWETPAVEAASGWDAPAEDGKPKGDRPPREEEVDNTLTFDEYLKKKDTSALTGLVGSLGPREANEGAKDLFKDAIQITKAESEDAYFAGKSKSAPKARAKKEDKVIIEIDGQFADSGDRDRGRGRGGRGGGGRGGDRGDRGGFGGGRGRGEGRGRGRGGRNGAQNVDVSDESAFPTLGGTHA